MSKVSFLSFHGGDSKKPSAPKQALLPHKQPQKPSTGVARSTSHRPTTEELKKIFSKFDTNGDGKISLEEYKLALKVLSSTTATAEAEHAFSAADTDGDGFIDMEEFNIVYSADGGVKMSEIQAAFRVFDADGNGKISAEELMEVLKRMGEMCSLEGCRKMIKGVDRDGDGLIDMDEFMTMMKFV